MPGHHDRAFCILLIIYGFPACISGFIMYTNKELTDRQKAFRRGKHKSGYYELGYR